jgi:hypothetical protein
LKAISANIDCARQLNEMKKIESECFKEFMKLIMDDKSRHVFGTIFLMNGESSDVLIGQLKFTKKQFYSRMTRLVKARLIRRHKGKYFLTSYGTVIYDAHRLLETAVKNYWKLRSVDLVELANKGSMPKEERIKIIDQLITNQQIKKILISGT